jgi:type VI secretion system secreted protein Hcp
MPIYMGFFEKPNVLVRALRGEVTAEGFEGWIELQSAQLGTRRRITTAVGRGTNRDKPSISEIVITKEQDSVSVPLYRAWRASEGKLVVIAFVRDGTTYMTVVLRDTLISNYATGGYRETYGKEVPPMESLSLTFSDITYDPKDKSPSVNTWSVQKKNEEKAF